MKNKNTYMKAIQLPRNFVFDEGVLSNYDSCFVLGNGPTLNKFKLDKLQSQIVVGCNRILHSGFIPTILCIGDKNALYDNYQNDILESDAKLVVGIGVANHLINELNYPSERIDKSITYFNKMYSFEYSELYPNNFKDIFSMGNVLNDISIPLAAFLGIKNIFIIGLDSYHINAQRWHFYNDTISDISRDFIPRIARYHQIWAAKQDILARAKGIHIYNLTPGSAHLGYERHEAHVHFSDILDDDPVDISGHYIKYNGDIYRAISALNENKKAFSLQNVKNGKYIRHSNFMISEDKFENEKVFRDDASFFAEHSFTSKDKVSFQSCNCQHQYITKDIFAEEYKLRRMNDDFLPDQSSFEYFK